MDRIMICSYAKINLSIDVGAREENGYHAVDMIMQQLSFHDDVTIQYQPGKDRQIRVKTNRYYLPTDRRNLAYQAAELMALDSAVSLARLMTLYGVGEKVATCVLLYGLHHLDAFPVDVWVRRILENEYPQGYPFERYRPYNGVYQQYMFAYYRMLEKRSGR